MKIIKFKQKKFYSYKRKVLIRDLVLNMLVGIHNFEKKKKQRVKFNLVINIDQNLVPNDRDLKSIVNYEQVIMVIKKILLRIEKLDVIKNTTSVGIELEKTRSNEY